MKKKRKGCRNCKHGEVMRHGRTFPDIYCKRNTEGGWDAVCEFDDCCDKHEFKMQGKVKP